MDYLSLQVTHDFRTFQAGEVFDFSLPITLLVGENGSGKSSLLQALRGKFPATNDSLFHRDYQRLATNIEITSGSGQFFFFDAITDDGGHLNNAYDAYAFLTSGGFHTKDLSHGETQLYHLSRLVAQLDKFRATSPTEKIILVLDEFDKGFSLANQAKVINILTNLHAKYSCQIICATHNYLLLQKYGLVYHLATRQYELASDYLAPFMS